MSLSTDSITVLKEGPSEFIIKNSIEFDIEHMGQLFEESRISLVQKGDYYQDEFQIEEVSKGNGYIYYGIPGSGKTQKLLELAKPDDLILCFTNKACENIRARSNINARTFDSYFGDYNGNIRLIELLKNKNVFVDEFSMVPNKWMTLLYQAFVRYGITVYLFGDPNQCDAVDDMRYDYLNSPGINQMCPNKIELKYVEKGNRYDKKTHEMLENLLKENEINNYSFGDEKQYKNICYYNTTKDRVNKDCAIKFIKEYGLPFYEIKDLQISKNMPVILNKNLKDLRMYNSQIFTIQDINDENVWINDCKFGYKEFKDYFDLAFCITVYKYQGDTIYEPYYIYDACKMDKKELYTALSRTTNFEFINIGQLRNEYFNRTKMGPTLKPYKTEYHNGLIYYVKFIKNDPEGDESLEGNDQELVYIGSTTRTLDERLMQHKNDKKAQFMAVKQRYSYYVNSM